MTNALHELRNDEQVAPTYPRKVPAGKRYIREITIVLASTDLKIINARANEIESALEKENGSFKRGVDGITFHGMVVR